MFKRIFELEQQNRRVEITFEPAPSAPDDKRISAPHYLIIVQDRDAHVRLNHNFINDYLVIDPVDDPTEARAKGFFRITMMLVELAEKEFKLVYYRRTTFAITSHLVNDLIVPGLPYEPIVDYVDKIDEGHFQCEREFQIFLDEIRIYHNEYKSDDDNIDWLADYEIDDSINDLANLMGDE